MSETTTKKKGGRPRLSEADHAAIVAARRKTQAEARRAQTSLIQNIGKVPPCREPNRRADCLADLRLFCKTYFPKIFSLPWSRDHQRIIPGIQKRIEEGEDQAYAMPRGSGKTMIACASLLFASLGGTHPFTMFLGKTIAKAHEGMLWFKSALASNRLLLEDFPEVCYPIHALDGQTKRKQGQHIDGAYTKIGWDADRIVFPCVAGSAVSGFNIVAASADSAIRGGFIILPDGSTPRLSLCMADDPQTDESARSQGPGSQTDQRLQIICSTIRGMAGPERPVTILVPCTIIESGDLADQLLNRNLHPEFHGERTSRVKSWPTHMKTLWQTYRELREDAQRANEPLDESREFYRQRMCTQGRRLDDPAECADCPHKSECMDCGGVVDWAERKEPGDLSALQEAMHCLYKYGERGFASEFQNKPLVNDGAGQRLTADLCMSRISGRAQREVPIDCTEVTCFIDVQKYSLWYLTCAWKPNFSGHVIDYGIWPEQSRPLITKVEIENSANNLQSMYPNRGENGTIQAGLEDLVSRLLSQNFLKAGGAGLMRIGRLLVDQGKWAGVVHAVKLKVGGATMMPSKGVGIRAGTKPMYAMKRKPGERWDPLGHWYTPIVAGTREFPHVAIDTNFWKSFAHTAFLTAPGDPGAITLFGDDPERHRLFAAHMTAETYVTPVSPRGVPVDEWSERPGRPDNEWLDCYDEHTEVLTRIGWKRFRDVTEQDEFATVNLETDFIEYQRSTRFISREHDGKMIEIKNRKLDLLVTPGHRMVVIPHQGKDHGKPIFRAASDLTVWDKIKLFARWKGKRFARIRLPRATKKSAEGRRARQVSSVNAGDFAEFLGWYVSEGSCHNSGRGNYRVTLSQEAGDKADCMKALLDRLPWKWRWDGHGWTTTNKQLYEYVHPLGGKYHKYCPQWVKDSDSATIERFLFSAVSGDGWRDKSAETYATVSRRLADDIQELYIKAGFSARITERQAKPYCIRGREGNAGLIHWVRKRICPHGWLTGSRKLGRWSNPCFREVDYRGMIYCVSVPNETLIVRRNGKPAVCGNCMVGNCVAASMQGCKRVGEESRSTISIRPVVSYAQRVAARSA